MTPREWESLCDRCGRCCLNKVWTSAGKIRHTCVACRLINPKTGLCSSYATRSKKVSDCVTLTWRNVGRIRYLPPTCAYRLLSEGKDLPEWHPLVSGRQRTVQEHGISIARRVILEGEGINPDDYVTNWIPA